MIKIFLFLFLVSSSTFANVHAVNKDKSVDFSASQLNFQYMSTDGTYQIDCTHAKGDQPHGWTVTCDKMHFDLHLMLVVYPKPDETIFEFHFWATENAVLNQSHTQSTWLTVDKTAKTKKIVSYVGFSDDTTQLRVQLNLAQ
jgi:hypothetical protein